MTNLSLHQQIQSRIAAFAEELSELVKVAALDSVQAALGGTAHAAQPKRGPGRPASSAPKAGARDKRTPEVVAKTAELVLTHIKAHAGKRLEEIARDLEISTKDLKLPITKLNEAKKLKTTGQKRGMKYFAK